MMKEFWAMKLANKPQAKALEEAINIINKQMWRSKHLQKMSNPSSPLQLKGDTLLACSMLPKSCQKSFMKPRDNCIDPKAKRVVRLSMNLTTSVILI